MRTHFINGEWREGEGKIFTSLNPATGTAIWEGKEATEKEIQEAIQAAKKSFYKWSIFPVEERINYLKHFQYKLEKHSKELAHAISEETGKPLWESSNEVISMVQKIPVSIDAYYNRCPNIELPLGTEHLQVRHKPYGIVAVIGPFNFPGHLPNGHIVPALLAGNTIILKGSEQTPTVSQKMIELWDHLPNGVLNLIQGGPSVGHSLANSTDLKGLFFTGSYRTGYALMQLFARNPEKILALEMGGNNPLVVTNYKHLKRAVDVTIRSAFLSAGQRCTCARRLILLSTGEENNFLELLIEETKNLRTGPYTLQPEPFMGPVISKKSAESLLKIQAELKEKKGIPLLEMRLIEGTHACLTPGIMDVTQITDRLDEEIFGPFLQVIRVPTFESAINEANNTAYGLVASILTSSQAEFETFYQEIAAGVINWNAPTTGASGKAPFGGIGKSGNHRPSGYYAADYCSYPVASIVNTALE